MCIGTKNQVVYMASAEITSYHPELVTLNYTKRSNGPDAMRSDRPDGCWKCTPLCGHLVALTTTLKRLNWTY